MGELGNKDIMADNIKYYMNKYEKTRQDMCEALGVKYTTFTDWVNGNVYPRIDKIELMANYFGITKADLVENRHSKLNNHHGIQIPVLGRVAAGIPLEAVENIIDYEEISEGLAHAGEFFGLVIDGDSMEPKLSKGDVVIVRKQDYADNGDLVIVLVNGNDATCKRFKKYDGGLALLSLNPQCEPIIYSNAEVIDKPVQIIGVVVEGRQKYKRI